MIRTITGLFETLNDAQGAAKELLDRGIPREDVSLVTRDASEPNDQQHEVGAKSAAGTGALSGSVVGGAFGLMVGAGLFAIPGIGPVLAIGPLAAAIGTLSATVGSTALAAGVGGLAGGLAGGLIDVGIPAEAAHVYAEGVRRGGVLLTVSVEATIAERVDVDAVLSRYGVIDIDQRGTDWHPTGRDPSVMAEDSYDDTVETWKKHHEADTEPGAVVKTEDGVLIAIQPGSEDPQTNPQARS